jgi:hypothetical protein
MNNLIRLLHIKHKKDREREKQNFYTGSHKSKSFC